MKTTLFPTILEAALVIALGFVVAAGAAAYPGIGAPPDAPPTVKWAGKRLPLKQLTDYEVKAIGLPDSPSPIPREKWPRRSPRSDRAMRIKTPGEVAVWQPVHLWRDKDNKFVLAYVAEDQKPIIAENSPPPLHAEGRVVAESFLTAEGTILANTGNSIGDVMYYTWGLYAAP